MVYSDFLSGRRKHTSQQSIVIATTRIDVSHLITFNPLTMNGSLITSGGNEKSCIKNTPACPVTSENEYLFESCAPSKGSRSFLSALYSLPQS